MKYLSILVLFSLINSCSPTKPRSSRPSLKRGDTPRTITKVTETESNVVFSPESYARSYEGNVNITVTPLDVNDINNITYKASYFSGEYQIQNFNIQSYEERLKEGTIPGLSRKMSKIYLSMISKLKRLNQEGVISDDVRSAFTRKIAFNNIGDEVYKSKLNVLDTGIDTYNPFKKDGKNFSVYQVDFLNSSSENVTFDIKNFIISSGFEQLNPYKESFYSTLYADDINKLQLAKRLNMPDLLVIPSGSKVRRYLTTSPLNPETTSLSVKLINDKTSISFDYDVKSSTEQNSVSFYNYKVDCEDSYKYMYNTYFAVLKHQDGSIMTIKNENMKISEFDINGIFTLYAIGFNSDAYSFGMLKDFKFNDIKSKEVKVDFSSKSMLRN